MTISGGLWLVLSRKRAPVLSVRTKPDERGSPPPPRSAVRHRVLPCVRRRIARRPLAALRGHGDRWIWRGWSLRLARLAAEGIVLRGTPDLATRARSWDLFFSRNTDVLPSLKAAAVDWNASAIAGPGTCAAHIAGGLERLGAVAQVDCVPGEGCRGGPSRH
jgi:hypothetical protein